MVFWDRAECEENVAVTKKLKCKSSWSPSVRDALLESYLPALERELLAIPTEGKSYSNFSQSELSALSDIKRDRNIAIKGADKGSVVLVWDWEDYIVEANRQLSDRQVYEEVDRDPTVDLSSTTESRLQDLSV